MYILNSLKKKDPKQKVHENRKGNFICKYKISFLLVHKRIFTF